MPTQTLTAHPDRFAWHSQNVDPWEHIKRLFSRPNRTAADTADDESTLGPSPDADALEQRFDAREASPEQEVVTSRRYRTLPDRALFEILIEGQLHTHQLLRQLLTEIKRMGTQQQGDFTEIDQIANDILTKFDAVDSLLVAAQAANAAGNSAAVTNALQQAALHFSALKSHVDSVADAATGGTGGVVGAAGGSGTGGDSSGTIGNIGGTAGSAAGDTGSGSNGASGTGNSGTGAGSGTDNSGTGAGPTSGSGSGTGAGDGSGAGAGAGTGAGDTSSAGAGTGSGSGAGSSGDTSGDNSGVGSSVLGTGTNDASGPAGTGTGSSAT